MRLSPASASRLRGIFVCISGILWYNIGREFPIGGVRMNTLSRTEIEQVIRELLHNITPSTPCCSAPMPGEKPLPLRISM